MLRQWMLIVSTLGVIFRLETCSGCRINTTRNGESRCCANYHEKEGECVECPEGTYGLSCSAICPNGYYGKQCTTKCNCSTGFECTPRDGCVQIADISNGDMSEERKEIAQNKTVLGWFEIAGLLAFGSLVTIGLIALLVYLKRCCRRHDDLPMNLAALLETLRPIERRSQMLQRRDAEQLIGATGGVDEKEDKLCSRARGSVNEYSNIATLSLQRAASIKHELNMRQKQPLIAEKDVTLDSKQLCVGEDDDIDVEDYTEMTSPLVIPPQQMKMTAHDDETSLFVKIPFPFQNFSQDPQTRYGTLDLDNKDEVAVGRTEMHCDDLKESKHPKNAAGNENSFLKQSVDIEEINDNSKDDELDDYIALDLKKTDSHPYNVTSTVRSDHDKERTREQKDHLNQNHDCFSAEDQQYLPPENTEKAFSSKVTNRTQKSAEILNHEHIDSKCGNTIPSPSESILLESETNNLESNKETMDKTGSSSFVASANIHHSHTNISSAELHQFHHHPFDALKKDQDAGQCAQNLQADHSVAQPASPGNNRPYSVVVKRSKDEISTNDFERKPNNNQICHSEVSKYEQPHIPDACLETPSMVTNTLPDLVLSRQINTESKGREYSMAFNSMKDIELHKAELQSTLPSKENSEHLKDCRTLSEKANDKKISKGGQNQTSVEVDDDGVYEDYENVKKLKPKPAKRFTKLKASVISTVNRMKSTRKSKRGKEDEMSKSMKMQDGNNTRETILHQKDLKNTSLRSDNSVPAGSNLTEGGNNRTMYRPNENSPENHHGTFHARPYSMVKPSSSL